MAFQNPRAKRLGPFSVDEPLAGAAPSEPAQLSNPGIRVGGGGPVLSGLPGQILTAASGAPAPAENPQAPGTRFGLALRNTANAAHDFSTAGANRALRVGTSIGNALSQPLRSATGFGVDAMRAATGDAPRADAGNACSGVVAPQFSMPGRAAAAPAPGSNSAPAAAGAAPRPTPALAAAATQTQPPAVHFVSGPGDDPPTRPTLPVAPQIQLAANVPMSEAGTSGTPRPLGYGAMVNGVPTFSDGTGGIARTMSPDAFKQLAQEKSIGRADPGALGHALASDSMGGATPTQGQMVDQRVAQAQLTRPITGSRPTAAQFAEADRLNIASRDPRSAAGSAARNLSIDAQYGGTPRTRKLAADQLASLEAGTAQSGVLGQQAEAASALSGQQSQAQLTNTALQGQNTLANTALQQRNALLNTPLEKNISPDGTVQMINPRNGAVINTRQADGTPAKALVTKDDSASKRANELQDTYLKGVQSAMTEYQKNQALLPANQQKPMDAQMLQQVKEQQARALGFQIGTDPRTGQRVAKINGQVVTL